MASQDYPDGTEEPHYDATPAVEKALQWIQGLGEREFVGTESRLNVIFELLRQIAFGTEADPAQRLAELRRQRQELDEQIARVQAGELPMLDETAVRDRYQQFAGSARELLADFREVDENFRKLDRQLREKIAGWHGGKGELLDDPRQVARQSRCHSRAVWPARPDREARARPARTAAGRHPVEAGCRRGYRPGAPR